MTSPSPLLWIGSWAAVFVILTVMADSGAGALAAAMTITIAGGATFALLPRAINYLRGDIARASA